MSKKGDRDMEEKEEIIINEEVDKKLKDFEKVLKEIVLPIKSDADFINQVLYAPISDETKERVIGEIHEDMKKRVEGYGV